MSIFVIGFNYKTAPISLREKVYFATDKLSLYLQDVLANSHVHEAVLLSTCNRSELICDADDLHVLRDWFCAQTTWPRHELENALYIYRDEEAIAHIMQVACGLDSMILGEPQILGQMKEAFSESCTAGAVGVMFQRLFQQIFMIAKEIRTTTAIGACPVSIASAAVHFAKKQFSPFSHAQVVLVGAGDTARLLMRYLATHLSVPISVINRNQDKAEALIEEFGGQIYGLEDLPALLAQADVVFSATSSAVPLINKAMMKEVMEARQQKPITLLDVAVPRDIEPSIVELPHVHLYCIDTFKNAIENNRKGREHAAEKASEMILTRSRELLLELQSFDKVAHTIRAYRGQIEELCRIELIKAKQLLYQGADSMVVLDTFAHAFTKKLMHAPSVQLRQAGAEGRFELLRFAKQLFSLPDPETKLL